MALSRRLPANPAGAAVFFKFSILFFDRPPREPLILTKKVNSRNIDCVKIIADTNTFLAVALNEPEKSEIIKLTIGHDLIAPDVLPFEIGNALSAIFKMRRIDFDEVLAAWDSVQEIPVELWKIDIRSALRIATTFNIYAYDAYFLECAATSQFPLLTLDKRMRSVAQKMKIRTLEIKK
ncbi:putative nucleic acid-binding protein, contains PIN domain [Candidatus Desulfarcum epimagneticum]|uniref:Putative nucleic acid-binding protein, contains PIN domain n=1 Tax=uncultured Desulfobacteraceae bacterium TaxID=218296 RepID=A0A484HGN3_9BACT|nr:putative nucleic acid-binding protein, contains PIN domain [uncultured Desulfobacteraceae bacterium]